MNKEQVETEKYKMPLSPRAEEFIFKMAHKTELLEKENKRLLERLKAAESVVGSCQKLIEALVTDKMKGAL